MFYLTVVQNNRDDDRKIFEASLSNYVFPLLKTQKTKMSLANISHSKLKSLALFSNKHSSSLADNCQNIFHWNTPESSWNRSMPELKHLVDHQFIICRFQLLKHEDLLLVWVTLKHLIFATKRFKLILMNMCIFWRKKVSVYILGPTRKEYDVVAIEKIFNF